MRGSRRALIIANGKYAQATLRDLLAPAADAEALRDVLRDPQIGDFTVRVSRNDPSHLIQRQIEDMFSDGQPDDLLLLHFSGHGLKSESGKLFFAAHDTRPDRLRTTAVSAELVQQCMEDSRSRRIVLLLDCCYGGAFTSGVRIRAGEDAHVLDSFPRGRLGGRGRAVITASSAMEYAFEGDRLDDDRQGEPSVFTSALVHGLATGEADHDEDGLISLDELYNYLFDQVRAKNPHQTPTRRIEIEGELYIAHSRRRRTRPASIPADIDNALRSRDMFAQLGAVTELRRLLESDDATTVTDAFQVLEETSRTADHAVAAHAAEALRTGTVQPAPSQEAAVPAPRDASGASVSEKARALTGRRKPSVPAILLAGTVAAASIAGSLTYLLPRSRPPADTVAVHRSPAVTATIPLGSREPESAAINSAVHTAYITMGDGTVTAINTASNHITATIHVGDVPDAVAVDPTTDTAYVANASSNSVLVVSTVTNHVTATIPLGSYRKPASTATDPAAHAPSPSTSTPSTPSTSGSNCGLFGCASGTSNTPSPSQCLPFGGCSAKDTVLIINSSVSPAPVFSDAVAVDPAALTAYVTNAGDDTVTAINTATNHVTATIPVGQSPGGVAIDPATHTAYVTNARGNSVTAINTATNHVTATIPVGQSPGGVAIDPATRTAYVANAQGGSVSVINTARRTVTATIHVGDGPGAVAIDPATRTAYVTNGGSDSVSVISTATNHITAALHVGRSPDAVAVDPATHTAYVTNANESTVSVIKGG